MKQEQLQELQNKVQDLLHNYFDTYIDYTEENISICLDVSTNVMCWIDELKHTKKSKKKGCLREKSISSFTPMNLAEWNVLSYLIKHPDLVGDIGDVIDEGDFDSPEAKEVYRGIFNLSAFVDSPDIITKERLFHHVVELRSSEIVTYRLIDLLFKLDVTEEQFLESRNVLWSNKGVDYFLFTTYTKGCKEKVDKILKRFGSYSHDYYYGVVDGEEVCGVIFYLKDKITTPSVYEKLGNKILNISFAKDYFSGQNLRLARDRDWLLEQSCIDKNALVHFRSNKLLTEEIIQESNIFEVIGA